MRYDRQVIGYHACRKEVADRLLLAGEPFHPSRNDWDWLGSGVYFWEYGHQRAHDWARQWPRLAGTEFAVVGALLQLGECLDLLDTEHTRRLAAFATQLTASGAALPANAGPKRLGDCSLINTYCERMEQEGLYVDKGARSVSGGRSSDGGLGNPARESHPNRGEETRSDRRSLPTARVHGVAAATCDHVGMRAK